MFTLGGGGGGLGFFGLGRGVGSKIENKILIACMTLFCKEGKYLSGGLQDP